MIHLRHLLLPVDFSDSSIRATEYAVDFARKFSATIHLVHVIEDPVIYSPIFESYPMPSSQQFETYAEDRLDNWILPEHTDGLKIERMWMHGQPATRIVEYAVDCHMDLVVMGTHGRGAAFQWMMGSVAEKVIRGAPCPVLTVRADMPSGAGNAVATGQSTRTDNPH